MTTDGVVQRRSQPCCKKEPLCLALIGCIVNSNSLGSKQPQHTKPHDILKSLFRRLNMAGIRPHMLLDKSVHIQ